MCVMYIEYQVVIYWTNTYIDIQQEQAPRLMIMLQERHGGMARSPVINQNKANTGHLCRTVCIVPLTCISEQVCCQCVYLLCIMSPINATSFSHENHFLYSSILLCFSHSIRFYKLYKKSHIYVKILQFFKITTNYCWVFWK